VVVVTGSVCGGVHEARCQSQGEMYVEMLLLS
jgi:hypothetical protein